MNFGRAAMHSNWKLAKIAAVVAFANFDIRIASKQRLRALLYDEVESIARERIFVQIDHSVVSCAAVLCGAL